MSLFNCIDAKKADIHILSYGVSVTTMEEVFLKCVDKSYLFVQNAWHSEAYAHTVDSI